MLAAEYRDAENAFTDIVEKADRHRFTQEEKSLYDLIRDAFRALISSQANPSDKTKEDEFWDRYFRVAESDEISGMWGGSNREN